MVISIKPNVNLRGLSPQMALAVPIIASVYEKHGAKQLRITGGCEHVKGRTAHSRHYSGEALDFGIIFLPKTLNKRSLVQSLARCLGPQYDIVLKSNHIHIEFDPK